MLFIYTYVYTYENTIHEKESTFLCCIERTTFEKYEHKLFLLTFVLNELLSDSVK